MNDEPPAVLSVAAGRLYHGVDASLGALLLCFTDRPAGWPATMAISDPELLRLQDALRVARERLAMVRQNVDDRAAIKAAEDLCTEAAAAVAARRRLLLPPRDT